jgi:opacity protein-like surface antigen
MPPLRPRLVRSSLLLPLRGVVGACCLAGPPAALATDFSIGLGLGADHGRVDCVAAFPCEHSGTHWKLTGGYRITDAVELQATWFDAGRFDGGDTTPLGTEFGGRFAVSGLGFTAGYRWSLTRDWGIAGRAGAAAVKTRFEYAAPFTGSVSKTQLEPLAGLGIAYAVTPQLRIGIDYDITRFKVHTTRGTLQMFGAAAQYSF